MSQKAKIDFDQDGNLTASMWAELYRENALEYRYFLDWRHRIMARHFILVASALSFFSVAEGRYITDPNFVYVPMAIWAAASILAGFLDRKNGLLARRAGKVGIKLEGMTSKHFELPAGFHSVDKETFRTGPSYDHILSIWYFGQGCIALIVIAWILVF